VLIATVAVYNQLFEDLHSLSSAMPIHFICMIKSSANLIHPIQPTSPKLLASEHQQVTTRELEKGVNNLITIPYMFIYKFCM